MASEKWQTLKHNGFLFPPPYSPHHIPLLYNNEPIELLPEQEEAATFFAGILDTNYASVQLFRHNFWLGFSQLLGPNHKIKCLAQCDFSLISNHLKQEKQAKLSLPKDERMRLKQEAKDRELPFAYCEVDGKKLKVANYKIVPPGLFRGRGNHPKMGVIKPRLTPEDFTINIGSTAHVPDCEQGHKWGKVISDKTKIWLGCYSDAVTNTIHYIIPYFNNFQEDDHDE